MRALERLRVSWPSGAGLQECGAIRFAHEQARVVSLLRGYNGFVEDGSFRRLREVAVTWTILPG